MSDDTFEFLLYYIGEYWDILQKQEYLFINIKGDTIGKPLRVDSVYDMFERMEKRLGSRSHRTCFEDIMQIRDGKQTGLWK